MTPEEKREILVALKEKEREVQKQYRELAKVQSPYTERINILQTEIGKLTKALDEEEGVQP